MPSRTMQHGGAYATARVAVDRSGSSRPPSITALAAAVGPVVYFMRTADGLIKVGHTTRLAARKRRIAPDWSSVLAIRPGTLADEAALLARFAQHLARGQEYFTPAPEIIAEVNSIRLSYGLPPVE